MNYGRQGIARLRDASAEPTAPYSLRSRHTGANPKISGQVAGRLCEPPRSRLR